jgi:hypothetical protein
MTFSLATLQNWITETETDVLNVVAQIRAGEAVIASDISAALHWIASNAPTIASDIEEVVGIVTTVGLATNPQVSLAITAANTAVTALNAFAAASNSGASNTQAVLAGYVAVQQATAAVASAKAAVAQPA